MPRIRRGAESRRKIDERVAPSASVFLTGLGFFEEYPYKPLLTACALLFMAILRYTLSLQPYSGMGKPPMYGDYEAQRHWMEITTALPVGDWYRNTTDNDLMYWGLDYPPLTAYASWVCGKFAQVYEPELVALHSSRGYETPSSKVFMRITVLVMDALYMVAAYLFVTWGKRSFTWSRRVFAMLVILGQPALLLIDHGHFQYNSFALGLVLVCIICLMRGRDVLGAVAFCLALNFKQMTLYFSPAVFFYYLARCIKAPSDGSAVSVTAAIGRVAILGVTVIGTFAAMWWPFCVFASPGVTCTQGLGQVVHRLFPFERGLFEDKVSNLWCIADVLLKLRRRVPAQTLVRASTGLTLVLMAPSCLALITRRRTSIRAFLWALFCCSMSFFLASFQVHEKSILMPLLPVALLGIEYPVFAGWFGAVASFSMFPLLLKDGLAVPYVLSFPWFLSMTMSRQSLGALPRLVVLFVTMSLLGGLGVHLFVLNIPGPWLQRWPDLGAVAISAYSCGMFVLAWAFGNYQLWKPRRHSNAGTAAREPRRRLSSADDRAGAIAASIAERHAQEVAQREEVEESAGSGAGAGAGSGMRRRAVRGAPADE